MRRDLVEWLLGLCDAGQPVVGYEMSPRPATNGWRNVVSHTCTMLHMPTMRRIGATWSFERYWESGEARRSSTAIPTRNSRSTAASAGPGSSRTSSATTRITLVYMDDNIDHVRSLSGLELYNRGGGVQRRAAGNCTAPCGRPGSASAAWRKEVRRG